MAKPISIRENIEYLKQVEITAQLGAAAAATAMAKYIAERTKYVTLQRSSHGVGSYKRQRYGAPPARGSGKLMRGMYYKPAYGLIKATALVGNRVDYSRILEYGCVIVPVNKKFLHWTDSAGSWYHTVLILKPHPFLEPTTEEAINDGSLQREAIEAFREYDP